MQPDIQLIDFSCQQETTTVGRRGNDPAREREEGMSSKAEIEIAILDMSAKAESEGSALRGLAQAEKIERISTWTADELIALSRRENRTVTEYPETPEAARALLEDLSVEASDDCSVWEHVSGAGYSGSEAAGYYDVWGDDWRVHVVTEVLS